MKRLKKRSTAALVLVLAAVLSVLCGGSWKLNQIRAAAKEAFFHGTAGFSMQDDLLELRETGYNLLRLLEGSDADEGGKRAAANAWAKLDEASTIYEYKAAHDGLSSAFSGLSPSFGDAAAQERWDRQMASFSEYESHLRFDSYYDEKAAAYNRLLERDPLTRALGSLSGGALPRWANERIGK